MPAPSIADPLVRNLATVGGNLAHADPANDHPATMLASARRSWRAGPTGTRTIPIDEFFVGLFDHRARAGRDPDRDPHSRARAAQRRRLREDRAQGRRLRHRGGRACRSRSTATANCAQAGIGLTNVGPMPIARRRRPRRSCWASGRRRRRSREAAQLAAEAAAARSPTCAGQSEYKRDLVRVLTGARRLRSGRSSARREACHERLHEISVDGQRRSRSTAEVEPRLLLVHFIRENLRPDRHAHRLRHHALRRLHGAARRQRGEVLHGVRRAGRRRARSMTVEGLEQDGTLHPLQEGFWQEHGLQCGFCTPGMMMTALRACSSSNPNPSEDEIRRGDLRQPLPLHRLRQHRQGHAARGGEAARQPAGTQRQQERGDP